MKKWWRTCCSPRTLQTETILFFSLRAMNRNSCFQHQERKVSDPVKTDAAPGKHAVILRGTGSVKSTLIK